jgi:hypothetical protein
LNPALDAAYQRSSRIVSRRIGNESVLVPIAGNVAEVDSLYTLNRVGAFLWERFDGRTDGHTLVAAVVSQFEVEREQAEADYLGFVGQLLEIGAMVLDDDGTSSNGPKRPR